MGGARGLSERDTAAAHDEELTTRAPAWIGRQRALGAVGFAPRWSPDGEWIAYLEPSANVGLVRADGTGARVLRTGPLSRGFAWSPDGRYLLARSAEPGGGLCLVRLADGAALSFHVAVDLFQPSWR